MKTLSLRLIAILTVALSLGACAPQPRRAAFDESAFVPYAHAGSATITGTAFTVLRDNKHERVASRNAVIKLMPANAYTDEIASRHYYDRVKLEPPDPRLAKYVRRVNPDDDGHFTFSHLPAGTYYVSCHLKWTYPSSYTDSDGTIWNTDIDQDQHIYARVSVGSGQTAHVEEWTQGK
ncbi:MAG: hypothetical protein P4L99_29885 [Chthoniobacter sp.]|nr:hypothetical protein [Chthoniobacter sp.]